MKKAEIVSIGVIVSVLLFTSVVVAVPPVPYPLDGYVKIADTREGREGLQITITNLRTAEVQNIQSHKNGAYSTDAANFPSKYENGDIIQYDVQYGDYVYTTTHKVDKEKGFNTMVILLTKEGEERKTIPAMEEEIIQVPGFGGLNLFIVLTIFVLIRRKKKR